MTEEAELDDLSDTLGLIYEASLNSEKWPYALDVLCEELGAAKAQLLYLHPEDLRFSFASGVGFDPDELNIGVSRFRRYLMHDPVALYAFENTNTVFSDRRVIDPRVLHQSPMQIDIRDPADMEYLLTVYITEDNADGTVLIFFRGKDQTAFTASEEAKLSRYVPHIKRATKIHKALSGSQQLERLQTAVLNHLKWGIMIVNDEKKIIMCNDHGEKIINENDALTIRNNKLICLRKAEQDALNYSISNVLEGLPDDPERMSMAVKIGEYSGDQSLFVVAAPISIQKFDHKKENLELNNSHYTVALSNRRFALLTFCDLSHHKNWSDMLQSLFDLTPAEAALLSKLADNHSLKEAAELLGRSVGTARIQLQSIFEKTGTNRQSSLVRLLMSIP